MANAHLPPLTTQEEPFTPAIVVLLLTIANGAGPVRVEKCDRSHKFRVTYKNDMQAKVGAIAKQRHDTSKTVREPPLPISRMEAIASFR